MQTKKMILQVSRDFDLFFCFKDEEKCKDDAEEEEKDECFKDKEEVKEEVCDELLEKSSKRFHISLQF